MDDDHEFALEISLQNIDDTNGSDEELDDISVISGSLSERFDEEGSEARINGGTSYPHSSLTNTRQPSIPSPPVSLKRILEDERSFMLFKRFVKDGCISRNLQFWLACEHFRRHPLDRTRLIESATAIYKRFLGSSAPLLIPVLDGTKRKIQITIKLRNELDNNMFIQAQSEVYHRMECNELRQFLLSDSFTDCSLFHNESTSGYFSDAGLESFQPATYGGGSLHSGSDDSTSITSFNSDMSGTVLCAPHHTKHHLLHSPRNAHSDTEHYTSNIPRSLVGVSSSKNAFFSRGKALTSSEFYELLYERLALIERDRANMQQKARDIARREKKTYENIMSIEWFDAPDAIKYIQFNDGVSDTNETPQQQQQQQQQQHINKTGSHIDNMAAKELQAALKDMEISRQVRQKRASSSTSSYISDRDSGVDSYQPSSGGGSGQYVQAYLQKQQIVNSQLSDREQQANIVAAMMLNNSTHHEDLSPSGRRGQYRNYAGAYSSDDNTSMSSNSELFVPKKTYSNMTDSEDNRYNTRYPQGMRRQTHHKRSTHTSSQQNRYYGLQQTVPHPQHTTTSMAPPPHQQQHSYQRDVIPPVQTAPPTKSGNELLLVAYTMEGFPNKMGKRLPHDQINTLADFKDKVFQRHGLYRFFFTTLYEGLEIMEELSDDTCLLPLFQGKIIGHVEKVKVDS